MKKEYPINKNLKTHLWIAIGLGLWVFLFLYLIRPLGVNEIEEERLLYALPIYGLIQSVTYVFALLYQQKIVKKQSHWLLKYELIFLLLIIISGAIINFTHYKYIIVKDIDYAFYFIEYIKLFYLPALVIIFPFVVSSRYILGKFSENNIEKKITIKGKGQYDFINLKYEELLFIQSSDNYIEINFKEGNTIHKKLLRGTISDVEEAFSQLLKTHRSFLINPIHFKQFKTENKKLFIDLGLGIIIPVSRGLQTEIKSALQVTTNK